MTTKYFLDPVCGYGNTVEVYIDNRLPEIVNEFSSKEEAIKYIYENEVYMFNYINHIDTVEAMRIIHKYGAVNAHIYHINWDEKNVNDYFKLIVAKLKEINYKNIDKKGMPKFDYIIQNPPYKRNLHLKFFELGLNILSNTGKMVIIEPSTWLINIRKSGNAKLYDEIKEKIKGHVKSVKIENLNNEFKINLTMPLSITNIDMEKTYKDIDFYCCGEYKKVHSIYDCNLIGNYNLIWSILNKCKSYKDVLGNHEYINEKSIIDENTHYIKFPKMIGGICKLCDTGRTKKDITKEQCIYHIHNNVNFVGTKFGDFFKHYIHILYYTGYEISNTIPERKTPGNKYIPGSQADCFYGSKEYLNNYKYYVYNNKLPLFISFCLTYDQSNHVLNYVPWLVDKKYTDEEIYNILGITEEEQKLIDETLDKFSRYSHFLGRYLFGRVFDAEN